MIQLHKKNLHVARGTNAGPICDRVEVADTFVTRLVGLLGRRHLPSDAGIWLHPSRGVHTFGMRFSIDVVALDSEMKVVGLYRELRAWRIAATNAETHSVLELSAGRIDASCLAVGDTVHLEAHGRQDDGMKDSGLNVGAL